MKKEITDYFNQRKAQGIDNETIKSELKQAGWNDTDISEEVVRPSGGLLKAVVSVVVGTAILVGIGLILYQFATKPDPNILKDPYISDEYREYKKTDSWKNSVYNKAQRAKEFSAYVNENQSTDNPKEIKESDLETFANYQFDQEQKSQTDKSSVKSGVSHHSGIAPTTCEGILPLATINSITSKNRGVTFKHNPINEIQSTTIFGDIPQKYGIDDQNRIICDYSNASGVPRTVGGGKLFVGALIYPSTMTPAQKTQLENSYLLYFDPLPGSSGVYISSVEDWHQGIIFGENFIVQITDPVLEATDELIAQELIQAASNHIK